MPPKREIWRTLPNSQVCTLDGDIQAYPTLISLKGKDTSIGPLRQPTKLYEIPTHRSNALPGKRKKQLDYPSNVRPPLPKHRDPTDNPQHAGTVPLAKRNPIPRKTSTIS